jgi:hypothetical protein
VLGGRVVGMLCVFIYIHSTVPRGRLQMTSDDFVSAIPRAYQLSQEHIYQLFQGHISKRRKTHPGAKGLLPRILDVRSRQNQFRRIPSYAHRVIDGFKVCLKGYRITKKQRQHNVRVRFADKHVVIQRFILHLICRHYR